MIVGTDLFLILIECGLCHLIKEIYAESLGTPKLIKNVLAFT